MKEYFMLFPTEGKAREKHEKSWIYSGKEICYSDVISTQFSEKWES